MNVPPPPTSDDSQDCGVYRRFWIYAICTAVAFRAILFIFAFVDARYVRPDARPLEVVLQANLIRWDAMAYLRIATDGYPTPDAEDWDKAQSDWAYFPFYPFLVYLASFAVGGVIPAAFLVSLIGGIIARYYLMRLVYRKLKSEQAALWVLGGSFCFPTSYYFALPYPIAVFLAFLLPAVLAAQERRWLLCGMLLVGATATRHIGVLAIPAILIGEWYRRKEIPWSAWPVLIGGMGALLMPAWALLQTGEPFLFSRVQEEFFFHRWVPPWRLIVSSISHILEDPEHGLCADVHWPRLVSVMTVIVVLVFARKIWWPRDLIYSWLCLLLFLSISWNIGFPRYLLAVYPIYGAVLLVPKHAALRVAFLILPGMFMLFLYGRFLSGHWSF